MHDAVHLEMAGDKLPKIKRALQLNSTMLHPAMLTHSRHAALGEWCKSDGVDVFGAELIWRVPFQDAACPLDFSKPCVAPD